MKKFKILTKTTRVNDMNFEDLADADTDDWRIKAERLQTRRWRKLKQQII